MKKTILATLMSATFLVLGDLNSFAVVVRFEFSGYLSTVDNPSNSLPAGVVFGAPFKGFLNYDTTLIREGKDYDLASTNSGVYYWTNGGFSLSVTVAGHTFSNIASSASTPACTILIHDNYSGVDRFYAETSGSLLRMDGGPLPGPQDISGMAFDLFDDTHTAYTNDALPVVTPQFSAFPAVKRISLYAYLNNQPISYNIFGTITNVSASSLLIIRLKPGKQVELAWPLSVLGFTLKYCTNLTSGVWTSEPAAVQDTATEHTVTVSATGAKWYRLSK